MTLAAVGLMTLAALGVWLFRPARLSALLALSVIALFLLQGAQTPDLAPALALPLATLALVGGVWWITNIPARLMPRMNEAARRRVALLFVILIVVLLAVLKLPTLQSAAAGLSGFPIDWGWFGFSYIAFRLMHVLLDYRIGRLAAVPLRDFALYVIFFSALPAGPIARIEQFTKDVHTTQPDPARMLDGFSRIGRGLLRKFVLADSLAYFALSAPLVRDASGGLLTYWVMLYAYAFRIFWDFSGYTDIAIGIGRLAGATLPENFDAPYLKPNITAFWNSWHITLATWFRLYFFMPLSRVLMTAGLKNQRLLVILIAQLSTMVLIGLWHGAAINFVLWGAWHGLLLWAHKVQIDLSKRSGWEAYLRGHPGLNRAVNILGTLATFHLVALGWVFFALPDLSLIGKTLAGLVGVHG